MPSGIRADPHVLPCRWDRQCAHPIEHLRIDDLLARGCEVLEALATPAAGDAGTRRVGATESDGWLLSGGCGGGWGPRR
jgi:hypothetical protein